MSNFTVKRHTIPASYPREYPRSTQIPNIRLKLSVNQYTPIYPNQTPSNSSITIIISHACNFHKELYEPFISDLIRQSCTTSSGFRIRNIWIADMSNQGKSGILNEYSLGDSPSCDDNALDILQIVNVFAEEIQKPIIGIGHSIGGQAVCEASLRNKGIFTALVTIDPILRDEESADKILHQHPAKASFRRRDLWGSREEAEASFRSNKFYKSWDPRVLDLQIEHGIRPLPTALYPTVPPNAPNSVTLATSKHQELLTFLKPHPTHPDKLWRPELSRTFSLLPNITIPILHLFCSKSYVSNLNDIEAKMKQNPNNAEMAMIENGGHLAPFEIPATCAELISPFLAKCLKGWEQQVEKDYSVPFNPTISEDFARRLSKI